MRMNDPGICNLCSLGALETPEHTFFSCPAVEGVWEKVRCIRALANLPTRITSWWEALTGIYDPPGQHGGATLLRDPTPTCLSNDKALPRTIDETPWEVLRCSLIWFLWCEKTTYDLRDGEFHVGVALFRA